jgi:hypothetical protein
MQSINTRKKHHNADHDACFNKKIQILIVVPLNYAQNSAILNKKMKYKQKKHTTSVAFQIISMAVPAFLQ